MAAPTRTAIILAFAAIYVIWGSTYLGILFAIQSVPPFLMAGVRYLMAGLIMYGTTRLFGAPRPDRSTWKVATIIGACLLLGGNGGVTISEKYIDSGLAAVIIATVPIYITLLGWLTGMAARPKPIVWLGLIGGFLGVALLLGHSPQSVGGHNPRLGMGILLFSSFIWSAGSLYSRAARSASSPFLAAGQQMICGGVLLILAGLATGEQRGFDPRNITWLSIGAFIYLVVIGALVGFTAYIWLLRHCEPAKVATYAYVNPVVAMILGTVFAHETLSGRAVAGAALIIGSVTMVITTQQFMPKVTPLPAAFAEADKLR